MDGHCRWRAMRRRRGSVSKQALAANPNDYDANLQLAVYSKEENKLDEARKYLGPRSTSPAGDFGVRYEMASVAMRQNNADAARGELESIVKESPDFVEAHVALATVYYRLKRKEDGDRERAIVQKLNAAAQDKQPGVNVK
jgi:Tfp pilus assembly protein PilF